MPSITITSNNLSAEGPTVDVYFYISKELEDRYRLSNMPIPLPVVVKALIDTGASNCCVNLDIPTRLGLQPVDVIQISTPSGMHQCYRYFMRMLIPSHNIMYEGKFNGVSLTGQNISCLIGRDLLAYSIFLYQGSLNQFTLTL